MKCNPDPAILSCLANEGCRFEVASIGELDLLRSIGVDPATSSTATRSSRPPTWPPPTRPGFGASRSTATPSCARSPDTPPAPPCTSACGWTTAAAAFPLSLNFGAEADVARSLLLLARELGLRPYGLTFHVGSNAWRQARGARLRVGRSADGAAHQRRDPPGDARPRWRVSRLLRSTPVPAIEDYGARSAGRLRPSCPTGRTTCSSNQAVPGRRGRRARSPR